MRKVTVNKTVYEVIIDRPYTVPHHNVPLVRITVFLKRVPVDSFVVFMAPKPFAGTFDKWRQEDKDLRDSITKRLLNRDLLPRK